MNARETILANIRRSTTVLENGISPGIPVKVPSPRFSENMPASLADRFVHMLGRVHGTVAKVKDFSQVPTEVTQYLGRSGGFSKVVIAPQPKLRSIDWAGLQVDFRAALKDDETSVTLAFAGIAETGTIAMVSSSTSPTTLNFLPQINIVVLEQSRIVLTLEDLWPLIPSQPRAINFITGPSKTADIEQTIVYGAHGPRHFHIVMIVD